MDKKANKINTNWKHYTCHYNYGSTDGDGYSISKSCSKKWLRELEKDFETMSWLHYVIEKTPEHFIGSCIVLFAKNVKTGYVEWSTIYVLGLLGQVIKKLAISWTIPSLALLLHIVLSMTDYVIIFKMY